MHRCGFLFYQDHPTDSSGKLEVNRLQFELPYKLTGLVAISTKPMHVDVWPVGSGEVRDFVTKVTGIGRQFIWFVACPFFESISAFQEGDGGGVEAGVADRRYCKLADGANWRQSRDATCDPHHGQRPEKSNQERPLKQKA